MNNMEIYTSAQKCPSNALREIPSGRLKGKSDINPMWRIQKLTELFGVCGFGWYYKITEQWLEEGAEGVISAFCNIDLYVKRGEEWSKPIQGTGGSAFVAKESKGLYTSDECYKMALTDAISVACKSLGFAADVYWKEGATKYINEKQQFEKQVNNKNTTKKGTDVLCTKCGKKIPEMRKGDRIYSSTEVFEMFDHKCYECFKKEVETNGQHT